MTPKQFKTEMKGLDAVRKGNGPIIAEMAKVRYPTYQSALSGRISNPRVLTSIVNATKALFEEFKQTGKIRKVDTV